MTNEDKQDDTVQTCNHIKENGIICGSPVLARRDFCYFHLKLRVRRIAMAQARARGQRWRFDLPPLEDLYAVQVGLMRVAEAIADDTIDPRRATLLLSALRQASSNLRARKAWSKNRFEITEDADDRLLRYDDLEKEHGLPEDADLSSESSWLFPLPELLPCDLVGDDLEDTRLKKRNALLARARRLAKAAQAAMQQANQLEEVEATDVTESSIVGAEDSELHPVEHTNSAESASEAATAPPEPALGQPDSIPEEAEAQSVPRKAPQPAVSAELAEPKVCGGETL